MERENEAPAERVFPASWTELSSKTCISLGKTLMLSVHAQRVALRLVSTVRLGVAAKTRSAEPRSPVVLRLKMERENEAPAERVFPASETELSSMTCISLGKTLKSGKRSRLSVHFRRVALRFISTVRLGGAAKTRSAEPRSPVVLRLKMERENEAPAERVFPASETCHR